MRICTRNDEIFPLILHPECCQFKPKKQGNNIWISILEDFRKVTTAAGFVAHFTFYSLASPPADGSIFLLQVQSIATQVTQTAGSAFGVAKDVFQQVFTAVKPAVDVATPYVKQTADAAYKAVLPVAVDLEQQAEKAIQSTGVDTKVVVDAAKV